MGTALMCSFWISSMLPMVSPDSLAMAKLSGKLALLKLVITFTCTHLELDPCTEAVHETLESVGKFFAAV